MEQVYGFFNGIFTCLMWFLLGAFVGAIIGALVIYIGAWTLIVIGGVVALGLHLTDKDEVAA